MRAPLRHSAICPKLIGRATYVEAVERLLREARRGHGHTLLLSGEAGIGKSRLIAEIKAGVRTEKTLVLQGACFEPDRTLPYGPLIDALRALLAVVSPSSLLSDAEPYGADIARLLPECAPSLPDGSEPPRLQPEQEKRRLFEALTRLLIRISARQPLILVVEDIHWADGASLEYLAYLARRLPQLPILLLLTYRSDEQGAQLKQFLARLDRERLGAEITLTPLAAGEVEEMLQIVFQLRRTIRREFLNALYNLTEGNPFFIEEVLYALVSDEEIYYEDGAWERKPLSDLHIPRSVQDAVQRRSEHLSPEARRVMAFAAAVGQRFEFALLQQVTGYDEASLLDLLKELIAAQLVVEQSAERFAFRHALTRQAVYAELLERERRTMHRAIAAALETLYAEEVESRLSELAYHTCQAGEWTRALDYARRAGERALAFYAPQAACEQFTQAIAAAQHLRTAVAPDIYRARANAYEILGDFERARSDLEAAQMAARASGDTTAEWAALLDLGLLWTGRDYAASGACFQRALTLVNSLDHPLERARTLNRLANWRLNIDEPLMAMTYHREALAIFEAADDTRGMAETLDLLCMASMLSGELAGGMEYGQRAMAMLRALDDRQPLSSTLVTVVFRSGVRQSQTMALAPTTMAVSTQEAEEGLRIAREMGWRAGETNALWVLSLCATASGEFGRAFEAGHAALALAEDIEHRQWMAASRYTLGELAYELYALALAREHLQRGLELARSIGSWHWIRMISGLLAATCVAQGDLAYAETVLDGSAPRETPMQTMGQRQAWIARGELAIAQDTPEAALVIAERMADSVPSDQRRRAPLVELLRGRALMRLDRYEDAWGALRATETVLREQGARAALRRVLTEQATLSRRMNHGDEARRVTEARELVHTLAETVPDAVLRAVFMRQALASLPATSARPAETTHAAAKMLTAREQEVAALVAHGKSNRAISEELVISERTTESHITNILGKLGFHTRTQIAAWAVDIGLARLDADQQPAQSTATKLPYPR